MVNQVSTCVVLQPQSDSEEQDGCLVSASSLLTRVALCVACFILSLSVEGKTADHKPLLDRAKGSLDAILFTRSEGDSSSLLVSERLKVVSPIGDAPHDSD